MTFSLPTHRRLLELYLVPAPGPCDAVLETLGACWVPVGGGVTRPPRLLRVSFARCPACGVVFEVQSGRLSVYPTPAPPPRRGKE